MNYTFTRADTCLYLDKDGLWKRGAVNYPQATNANDSLGFYFKGAWIPKALTNLFRDSEPASDPGQGTRNAISFSACDWALGLNTALDGMVTIPDSTTYSVYYNAPSVVTGNTYTLACLIKPNDGLDPTFGTTSANIGRFILGNTNLSGATILELGDSGIYLAFQTAVAGASPSGTGVIKTNANNTVGFESSAFGVFAGTVTWGSAEAYLIDYIRTTGSSVARADTDIRKTNFPLLANLQGYIDVEIQADSVAKRIFLIGANNNFLQIVYSSLNLFRLSLQIGGANDWTIETSAITSGRYRLAYYVSNGLNIFWINGVEIGRNTSAYSPQGSILVLGGEITGTANKLTNGGYFGQFMASGLSVSEWLARCNDWGAYGDLAGFQRTP